MSQASLLDREDACCYSVYPLGTEHVLPSMMASNNSRCTDPAPTRTFYFFKNSTGPLGCLLDPKQFLIITGLGRPVRP